MAKLFRPLTPKTKTPEIKVKKDLGKKREIYRRGQKELNLPHHNFSVYQCKILWNSNREINLI